MSDDSNASAGVLPLSSPSWQSSAPRSLHPADSYDELPVPLSPLLPPSDSDANATSPPTSADLRRQAFTFASWSRRVATSDGEDSADESSSAASNSLGRRKHLEEASSMSSSSAAAAAAAAAAENGAVDYQTGSWDQRRPPLKTAQSAGYAAPPSVFVFDGVQEVQIHGKTSRKTSSNGLEYSSKKPKDKRKVCIVVLLASVVTNRLSSHHFYECQCVSS